MPCVPNHRPGRLRLWIILTEVLAVIAALSIIALSGPVIAFWLLGIVVLLVHTILFYRLGRISERIRAQPAPDFIRELGQKLGERFH